LDRRRSNPFPRRMGEALSHKLQSNARAGLVTIVGAPTNATVEDLLTASCKVQCLTVYSDCRHPLCHQMWYF
jgi:hypothetical protein